MAKAQKHIIPAPIVKPTITVTLVLSGEEADTLLAILGRVGGSSVLSRRKHAAAMFNTLFDLHLNYNIEGTPDLIQTGSLCFTDTL